VVGPDGESRFRALEEAAGLGEFVRGRMTAIRAIIKSELRRH
jgi:hypothetical protein